jgi:hypothetical protein
MENKQRKLKIRIFGASECSYCKKLCEEMDAIGVPYDFLDANDSLNNDICDRYNVDKLPHIQCYSEGEKDIICEFAGAIGGQAFMNKVSEKISGKKGSVFQGKTVCKNCKKN